MNDKKVLDIGIENLTKKDILDKIIKFINSPIGFFHIVSLNSEILVIAHKNPNYKKVIDTAQIRLIDGIGIVIACRLLNVKPGERITGVDLMKDLIVIASKIRLRVLLIGGSKHLALRLAQCYQKQYPKANFLGTFGIKDIKNPQSSEEDKIFAIVADYKPHIVFAAFGSPWQELWLERHNKEFSGAVCMGVGQGFDVFGRKVSRAPEFFRKIGMEWLYRLMTQPWRWRRQLGLIKFIGLVVKQKISTSKVERETV